MPLKNPTVYLVDDDPSVLRAVQRLLVAEGFETKPYADALSFLAEHDVAQPGCIVLDVSLPGLSGIELQAALGHAKGGRPVVFISGGNDVPTSVAAMKAGAIDFLTKPFNDTVLLAAVNEAIRRDTEQREADAGQEDFLARFAGLTDRERAVFLRVIVGRLNKQIAADLHIVEKTVKVHRARMMKKMGVRSLAALVHLADKYGMGGETTPAAG